MLSSIVTEREASPLIGNSDSTRLSAIPMVYLAIHVLCFLLMSLLMIWFIGFDTGIGFEANQVFNLHPMFMTFGLVVCYVEAAISFRAFVCYQRSTRKLLHIAFHGCGLLSTIFGLRAVFKFHNDSSIPNLYSLHSWLGILTVVAYWGQYMLGFLSFWSPGFSDEVRRRFIPVHKKAGVLIFLLFVTCSILTGVLEKMTFQKECNDPSRPTPSTKCYVANAFGIVLVALTFLFGWLFIAI